MEFRKLESFLSKPRIQRFLVAAGNSTSKAQQLYRINLSVSQAFYPILNLFEIFLRNAVNDQVASYFDNSNWITSEKQGFMNDGFLKKSKFFLKRSVQRAEKTIERKGGKISSGKVISELSFGFWASLFEVHHYRLIRGVIIRCFPHRPNHVKRSIVFQKLNRIRQFRNRIYHNEPICFKGSNVNFKEAEKIKDEIFEMLSWIDSDLATYTEYFNGIESEIDQAKNI